MIIWEFVETAFKTFEGLWSAYPLKCFKGCLPQILLDPFLNNSPILSFFLNIFQCFGASF